MLMIGTGMGMPSTHINNDTRPPGTPRMGSNPTMNTMNMGMINASAPSANMMNMGPMVGAGMPNGMGIANGGMPGGMGMGGAMGRAQQPQQQTRKDVPKSPMMGMGMPSMGLNGMDGPRRPGMGMSNANVVPGMGSSHNPSYGESSIPVSLAPSAPVPNSIPVTPVSNRFSQPPPATQKPQLPQPQHLAPPPLPANVNLSRDITSVTIHPLSTSATAIPPLSPKTIKNVASWIKADVAYQGTYKVMKERMAREVVGNGGRVVPWWEKGSASYNPSVRGRMGEGRFDVRYPGMAARRDREMRERDGRRRGLPAKREGLKM